MNLPNEAVLDGYTLSEQHAIDHEFLMQGSPLSIIAILGMGLIGLAVLCRLFYMPGAPIAGIAGVVMVLHKIWWMPISLWQQFDDFQVFGYTLRYYPTFWAMKTLIVAVMAIVGVIAIFVRR
ncbi:hypothetical protein [Corynebacterium camporealensis]